MYGTAEQTEPAVCTSNFRMTLFALARSVTNRRADGGPSDSS